MFIPPASIILLLRSFAPGLTGPALRKAVHLVCGVILSPGRRTVASALRAVGLHHSRKFGKYHRLLYRDRWSAMYLAKLLLSLLIETFVAAGQPLDIVVDETLERRRGRKISYKSWFRDAVRSTTATAVTTSGVRWLCFCLLVRVPWSKRRWALPFCTVVACSAKNCVARKRLHRGTCGLTVDIVIKIRQWLGPPSRLIRLTGDGGFTNIDLMHHCNEQQIEQIGRLRLDAALYDAPGEQPSNKRGRKPRKGARQPSLLQRSADPCTQWTTSDIAWYGGQRKTVEVTSGVSLWHVSGQPPARLRWVLVRQPGQSVTTKAAAFFSSNTEATPDQIVACYAERWNIEVFFEEVRACLRFETQRGWTNFTIGRTTPCLFGIFSLVVILAKQLFPVELPVNQAAWYTKEDATFRDALAAVRQHLWQSNIKPDHQNNKAWSPKNGDMCLFPIAAEPAIDDSRPIQVHEEQKSQEMCLIPSAIFQTMREIACYAV